MKSWQRNELSNRLQNFLVHCKYQFHHHTTKITQEGSQWHQLTIHRLGFNFKESNKERNFLACFGSSLKYIAGHENQYKIVASFSLSRHRFNDSFYIIFLLNKNDYAKARMLELIIFLVFWKYYLQCFHSRSKEGKKKKSLIFRLSCFIFEIFIQVQNFCMVSNNQLYQHRSRNARSISNQYKSLLLCASTLLWKE